MILGHAFNVDDDEERMRETTGHALNDVGGGGDRIKAIANFIYYTIFHTTAYIS